MKWKKRQKQNNDSEIMRLAKKSIYKQAGMAVMAVGVALVLIFAMTVAWYSNVIRTEGLVFQATSWKFDFEGNIAFGEEAIQAAPGDSGIVAFTLDNKSDEAISVIVNVTKNTGMNDSMKRRIYFYVDAAETRNGETMDRVYVNETEEYLYSVMGQNTLTLSEEYNSDSYLKWEWVYDVLGYYVEGTLSESGAMDVKDYLRPIQYDYEKATFDSEGKLETVDGITGVESYVTSLLQTDGYPGNAYQNPQYEYYPVSVNPQTGHGVWLYLCNQREIEGANEYDTLLAEQAGTGVTNAFSAKLLLSGQQRNETIITVGDENALATQVNTPDIDKVTLSGDITLTDTLTISGKKDVVVDLQQNTLTLPARGEGIRIEEGSSLTLMNGELSGTGTTEKGIAVSGGEVVLHNIKARGTQEFLWITDNEADGADSRIKITHCNIETELSAVYVRGNGTVTARKTGILIEDSTLKSNTDIAIMGNGSASAWGTDIQIIRSTVTGYYSAVYQPQSQSNLEIIDSTLEGNTAIAIKGGNVLIDNSTVRGVGPKATPAFGGSGYSDTGDGIYVETNYGYDISVSIQGSDTKIASVKSMAIQVFEPTASHVTVIVTEGTYSSDVEAFLPTDDSCSYIQNADGSYTVGPKPASVE